ncbi:lycopene cyclase domain-containing protein [Paenarthrobacter ilicis]|uniref:Lycopene cyclase domain-containing protein n=2 Tax=Paenarthrobacter ilicis TaxID=43665 RepID=A0ABX0TIK0_9MICC|nr:lycopene cyclase domain-containing protein [Paenarthrobacter ilicis]NIJ01646.1 lycopene cyclase domain-containing protein [Paenarthrobacter ilicis]
MMGILYLVCLLLGITCMLLLDHRFQLFFWRDATAAAVVTSVGLAFLLAWDLAGIGLGIFLRGEGTIATGLMLAPELPVEEPVFLTFLVLCTMVLYTGARKLLDGSRKRLDGAPRSAPDAKTRENV